MSCNARFYSWGISADIVLAIDMTKKLPNKFCWAKSFSITKRNFLNRHCNVDGKSRIRSNTYEITSKCYYVMAIVGASVVCREIQYIALPKLASQYLVGDGSFQSFFSHAGRANPEIRLAVGQKNVCTGLVAHFFGPFFMRPKF